MKACRIHHHDGTIYGEGPTKEEIVQHFLYSSVLASTIARHPKLTLSHELTHTQTYVDILTLIGR